MNIKLKNFTVFLLISVIFLFSGCAENKKSENSELPALTIGSDIYSPYFYVDDNGNFAGIDVEIATEACKRLKIKPKFKQITWQNKDSFLDDGLVDCLWGSFSMNGRENDYTWAGPYLHSRQVVVVNSSSDIHTFADLNGKNIAVQNASKSEKLFLTDSVDGVCVNKVYSFPSMTNVFAALKKGYVDAAAGHETAFRDYMKNINGDFRIIDGVLLASELGVAFKKDADNKTVEELSAVLDEMRRDGTIRSIIEKYDIDADYALNGGLNSEK